MDKLRDKKWFRLSVGSSSGGGAGSSIDSPDEASPIASSNNNPSTLTTPISSHEPSRFEKFRRASFRRKSTGQTTGGRKRSKSPHSILQPDKSSSLEEADEDAEKERSKGLRERMEAIGELLVNRKSSDNAPNASTLAQQPLYKSEVDIVLKASANDAIDSLQPLSEIRPNGKKATLKSIKTDPPKRKFYKNFTTSSTRRQSSLENDERPPQVTPIVPLTLEEKLKLNASSFAKSKDEFDEDDDDDDTDSDSDDDDDDDESSEPEPDVEDNLPKRNGKEKILLTDRKFKHNRIEKSASKTKMSELEKRESLKRSRSARKIAAQALALKDEQVTSLSNSSAANKKKDNKIADKEMRDRKHSNLNLQAFVNFVMSNKKFLSSDEFTLTRRKSITDAASNMLTVAATCKPLPIAMKYAPEDVVAEAPKENDSKTERNVVLVKKQDLKNSFCDRLSNNNNNNSNNMNNNTDVHKYSECEKPEPNKGPDKPKRKKQKTKKSVEVAVEQNKEIFKCLDSAADTNHALSATVKRNSSNSSKSSGNFEDEAFYSYDEQDNERLKSAGVGDAASLGASTASSSGLGSAASSPTLPSDEVAGTQAKRKSSSPSLTSRVAAKINEKTNNYRNRRAVAAVAAAAANKMGKKRKTQRPEFYKQISVERLHASPIVRQPSDRRPDGGGNQASRSNGNATDSTDDVLRLQQPAFNAAAGADANASKGAVARGARDSLAAGGTAMDVAELGANGGAAAAADTSAQDAAEGKDARRERLHQQHQQNKSAPVSVNRSESYKERLSHKRNRNSRRKTSDPSLTSRPNDEQADVGLANSNYTASSNSSLSSGGGSESPSTSMEQVGVAGGIANAAHHHTSSLHGPHTTHHMHQHNHQDSFHGSIGSGSMNASFWGSTTGQLPRQWHFDSDDDDDLNETDWSSNVTADVLAALTDAEKKRQEIINEIYQTERSHVRTLKVLERIFLIPLQESGILSPEHLMLLFPPALSLLRELHASFEQKLKQRRLEHNYIVSHIGDLLASMFHGQSGDELCDYAAQFCARQQIALEALKEKRRKNEQLQKILSTAEAHKACRRLQLKDLLPAVLQRLTKYPLLFENLFKVTIRVVPGNTDEAEAIKRALESSKKILVDVNQAVKTAEDAHKLQNIQRKLDKSTFDKDEFKNLDLTQYRLIHDGSLTMKKNPSIQLHGLLFEDMIVLLTKQDDKYSLKYLHAARNTEVNNKPVSPIMSIDSETLVRQEAADKNSFFLIKTKTSQMLELRAPSSSECKTWFKHISDAAEQYKPRSKNANHEPVDDPAIATLPHSNTKESLELTPERPPPMAATATVTTTPLAPMMPIATATSVQQHGNNVHSSNNNNYENNVQLRNGRRESTPTAAAADNGAYYKQRLSQNELTPSMSAASSASSVNRTMSTRSCGEANNNNSSGYSADGASGVALRHTQSARQANGPNAADSYSAGSGLLSDGSKRDSASIVYSNNSNNTRTLMQSSPPLVEPTAIQISISPAHTAEPVLTPSERLRRVDAAIRDGLLEKQKIICDMFRLPVEHFNEIVDIAAMPEAPKDSADIALAAYAQVQSLTEVLNDYLQVTPEQEISAVSTAVCDQCHEKQQHRNLRQIMPAAAASPTSSASSSTATQIAATAAVASDTPPPLPPPNKQSGAQQAQQQTPTNVRTVLQNAVMDEVADIHEDDDGYCEIDELRLPALPPTLSTAKTKATSPPPPLPPPAGGFKVPPPPPPHPTAATTVAATPTQTATPAEASANTTAAATAIPELVKRQSTISADSIPEESADEVTKALSEDVPEESASAVAELNETVKIEETVENEEQQQQKEEELKERETIGNSSEDAAPKAEQEKEENELNEEKEQSETAAVTSETAVEGEVPVEDTEKQTAAVEADKSADAEATTEAAAETTTAEQLDVADAEAEAATATANENEQHSAEEEQIDINDAYDTLSTLNAKLNKALSVVDSSTQTVPMSMALALYAANAAGTNSTALKAIAIPTAGHCGPNRIQHANSLEPSVPCHALNSIVSALNAQISLLLPKISERDMERERLRKENQHLRELLNAMHERKRVEAKLETPTDITNPNSDDATNADEIDGGSGSSNSISNSNSDSPPTAVLTATSTPLAATSAAVAATTPTAPNADDSAATENTSTTEQPSTPTTTGTTATIIVEADN